MRKYLVFIFTSAFILRLLLVFSAYHGDLNNNISWGTLAVERGLNGFYENGGQDSPNLISTGPCPSVTSCEGGWPYSAPNQPPLTILMLAGVRIVWQGIESSAWWLNNNLQIFPSQFIWFWEDKGIILLIKLPAILADLGIGFLIFKYFQRKNKISLGVKLTTIWLFNPVTWYNSAIWGQTDSVVNLLGLLGVLALLEKRLIKFVVFFMLSFLFKGSLAIFIPILGVIAFWQKHSLKKWMVALLSMFFITIVVSVWFHPKLDLIFWIINLYKNRVLPGEIGYLTANSFNFWWLIDSGRVLDSAIFFGLPARIWGFVLTLGGILFALSLIKGKITDKKLFFSLAFISLVSFLLMTRTHERYLYPFFPYATLLLGFLPSFNIFYIILSATHLLNLYHLFWEPPIPILESLFQGPNFPFILAFLNMAIFIYLLRLLRSAKI